MPENLHLQRKKLKKERRWARLLSMFSWGKENRAAHREDAKDAHRKYLHVHGLIKHGEPGTEGYLAGMSPVARVLTDEEYTAYKYKTKRDGFKRGLVVSKESLKRAMDDWRNLGEDAQRQFLQTGARDLRQHVDTEPGPEQPPAPTPADTDNLHGGGHLQRPAGAEPTVAPFIIPGALFASGKGPQGKEFIDLAEYPDYEYDEKTGKFSQIEDQPEDELPGALPLAEVPEPETNIGKSLLGSVKRTIGQEAPSLTREQELADHPDYKKFLKTQADAKTLSRRFSEALNEYEEHMRDVPPEEHTDSDKDIQGLRALPTIYDGLSRDAEHLQKRLMEEDGLSSDEAFLQSRIDLMRGWDEPEGDMNALRKNIQRIKDRVTELRRGTPEKETTLGEELEKLSRERDPSKPPVLFDGVPVQEKPPELGYDPEALPDSYKPFHEKLDAMEEGINNATTQEHLKKVGIDFVDYFQNFRKAPTEVRGKDLNIHGLNIRSGKVYDFMNQRIKELQD